MNLAQTLLEKTPENPPGALLEAAFRSAVHIVGTNDHTTVFRFSDDSVLRIDRDGWVIKIAGKD